MSASPISVLHTPLTIINGYAIYGNPNSINGRKLKYRKGKESSVNETVPYHLFTKTDKDKTKGKTNGRQHSKPSKSQLTEKKDDYCY